MVVLHLFVPANESDSTDLRKLPHVRSAESEFCFSIDVHGDLTSEDMMKLKWLVSDPLEPTDHVKEESTLQVESNDQFVIHIGPRLNFSTPFSSNAVSICHSLGLLQIKRIEKSMRYLISTQDVAESELLSLKQKLIDMLHDPMTSCPYETPITSFDHGIKPEPWYIVDVLKEGRNALEKINEELGLSFDEWDLNFYADLFSEKLGRNPTSVECFDLAQSNSEHSRHWFFKGILNIDGSDAPSSLFEMIMQTQRYSNKNNIIKFSDNSSAIEGFLVQILIPEVTDEPSQFETIVTKQHLIFTAETHNFPTAVSPFSGAATGTGGRIRDIQAVGRGGNPIAGTVGYSVGNLLIEGYEQPWEDKIAKYSANFAKPLDILIEGSNGCSDYGNKFGEPVILGFTRSFGMTNDLKERKEYIKPILFTGGMGTVDHQFTSKMEPSKGMKVVKIGGPVYRIGVGGGSASSTKVQGDNKTELDFNAVQRGDPEMEQKVNRFVRSCVEFANHRNPILSIHDQGAGGNGNVLKELVEPEGAVIFTRAFELGDESISTLELWGAEYQENNAMLCRPDDIPVLGNIARRERCPFNVVGTVTGNGRVILTEEEVNHEKYLKGDVNNSSYPVDLDLKLVLGSVPKKIFALKSEPIIRKPLRLPNNIQLLEVLHRVLRHPTVCSKRFLTNKVDRSVTGLIVQQQCVGPLHTPVADAAVIAISYYETHGIATSIGEQPIKGLIDPAAGARMSVAEALSNLVFTRISSLRDVKCSGNWMWPAKLPGEGVYLQQACVAMCGIMKSLGIAVDGGKDSLSMATRLENNEIAKSPGTLVISAYAPCPDISMIVTPDLKTPRHGIKGCLLHIDMSNGKCRLAGSIFAQCYKQLGQAVPDIECPKLLQAAFNITQDLIDENKIYAGHDVSDGGLLTCLIEMALSGVCGMRIYLPSEIAAGKSAIEMLFAEECGWVLECARSDMNAIIERYNAVGLIVSVIGYTGDIGMDAKFTIMHGNDNLLDLDVCSLYSMWEETSYQIEKLQSNAECAREEFQSIRGRTGPSYHCTISLKELISPSPKTKIKVAVLREEGLNGDREMIAALDMAGFEVWDVTMQDLLDKKITLDHFRGLIFPGGFSYADVLGAAKGWAATVLFNESVNQQFNSFYNRRDTFSFGVCNGCQLMCLIGWIGLSGESARECNKAPQVILKENTSGRFESRFSTVKICPSPAIMLRGLENSSLGVWVAHGEGHFTYSSHEVENELKKSNCFAIKYVNDNDEFTEQYPFNPNGSSGGVAGICSPDGRHLAMMPHPERCVKFWQWPYIPVEWQKETSISDARNSSFSPWFQIFLNAYTWCRHST